MPACFGGARGEHLAVAVQQAGQSGRRDGDRHRHLFAEHRASSSERLSASISTRLAEADGLQLVAIGAQADLVVGAVIDVFEDRLGQLAARELAQVFDIGDDRHGEAKAGRLRNWPVLRKRHRYAGTIASIGSGSMPRPCSVRYLAAAASETTLSMRSSSHLVGRERAASA